MIFSSCLTIKHKKQECPGDSKSHKANRSPLTLKKLTPHHKFLSYIGLQSSLSGLLLFAFSCGFHDITLLLVRIIGLKCVQFVLDKFNVFL